MRRLDWFLAAVIGVFLAIAIAVQAQGWVSQTFQERAGRHLSEAVAADIARLPHGAPLNVRLPTILPAR
ncbi:MAG TPA: hypothetical protein VMT68_16470 [Caulobacteraceae bacterium]|nr:hypothetical protein [Caulobacteraceae bacterium]